MWRTCGFCWVVNSTTLTVLLKNKPFVHKTYCRFSIASKLNCYLVLLHYIQSYSTVSIRIHSFMHIFGVWCVFSLANCCITQQLYRDGTLQMGLEPNQSVAVTFKASHLVKGLHEMLTILNALQHKCQQIFNRIPVGSLSHSQHDFDVWQ